MRTLESKYDHKKVEEGKYKEWIDKKYFEDRLFIHI